MQNKPLMKSKERVKQHGEVFTPKWIVNKMLDQPKMSESIKNIFTTFLEPSAGEGSFLVEILKRRLVLISKLSNSLSEYEENALIGLSTLYGIELLEDNVEMLVMNLMAEFDVYYYQAIHEYEGSINKKIIQSAKVIISANMVQGDTLTRLAKSGEPIIFSEWQVSTENTGKRRVKRQEYTLDSIINRSDESNKIATIRQNKQLDLFSLFEEPTVQELEFSYKVVKMTDVGQQLLEEIK